MVSQKVTVSNVSGLHLRPAGLVCKEAMKFSSSVGFQSMGRSGMTVTNAKSVLSVLGACVKCGDEIEFICEGPDEEAALAAMVSLVESGLGE